MTDTPGWTSPGSTEPPGEDPRPEAGAGQAGATPQDSIPPQARPLQDRPPAGYGGWGPPPGQYPAWGAPPSPKPGVIPLRPLGVGELLDGSVSTVRRHWRTVMAVSLGLGAVQQTAQAVVEWLTFDWSAGARGVVNLTAAMLLGLLLGVIADGLLTVVVSRAVLGQPTNLKDAWGSARPRLGALLGLTLLYVLIVFGLMFIGLLPLGLAAAFSGGQPQPWVLLLVPVFLAGLGSAAWLEIKLSLAAPAVVLERQGVIASLRRSWRLSRASWWRLAGINLLTVMLILVISSVGSIPFTLLSAPFSDRDAIGMPIAGSSVIGLVIMAVGGTLVSAVTIPIRATMAVLLYIDQRIRREALDLELARAAGLPEYGSTGSTVPGQSAPPEA